jgi:hypothetical protein
MATKAVYTAEEVALAVAKRLGGVQALEVKEIQLFPLDATRKNYGCRYKNWNGGVTAAPIVIWKNRTVITEGFNIPLVKNHPDTPYEFSVNANGVVEFAEALTVDDVIHAGFTFRLFTESDLDVALKTVGFSTIASMTPISIDDQCIADFLVEPLVLATMVHLREGMLSEQSLYYSYSIQEQSHQLQQVHGNLESDINRDRAALEKLVDSDLWFRDQGHAKRTTSVLRGDRSTFGVPWIVGGARGDGR